MTTRNIYLENTLRKLVHAIYRNFFFGCKNESFHWKTFDIVLIFPQSIDCWYTLEPPRRGGSNEYPQSMFWRKNMKNMYTPAYPQICHIKVGYKGVYFLWTCFPDDIVSQMSSSSSSDYHNTGGQIILRPIGF